MIVMHIKDWLLVVMFGLTLGFPNITIPLTKQLHMYTLLYSLTILVYLQVLSYNSGMDPGFGKEGAPG